MTGATPSLPPGAAARNLLAERLDDLHGEVGKLRNELPQVNDDALRPPMVALLDAAAAIEATHQGDLGPAVADTLNQLLDAVRALRLPLRDPVLGDPTPTLAGLRAAKGLITTALMDCLDAARALGWEPQRPALPEQITAQVPREMVAGSLPHIAARLDAMAARLDDLVEVRDDAPQFPQQVGFINFYNTSMRAQVRLGKLELKLGDDMVDFAALWRIAERIGALTEDFYVTVRAWVTRLSASVVRVAEGVRQAARRVVGGIASAVKLVRRRGRPAPLPEPPQKLDPPDDFDLDEARRLILAGTAPPPAWRPHLVELDFTLEQLSDLTPLSGLTALQTLHLMRTQVSSLTPLAGLTALQRLVLWGTQVSDLTPLAGLTALQSLDLTSTSVSDLTPLAGLTALQSLSVGGTQVSDLTPLAGLTALQSLSVGGTQVSSFTPLAGLTALQSLDLLGTQVSDLTPLAGLTALQSLDLWGTQVSAAARSAFNAARAATGLRPVEFR